MSNKHLTDETLQAYLLEEIQDDSATAHLLACPSCREKLGNYQHLIVGIQKVPPETFSFDVTTVVMDSIILYERQKGKKQELVLWSLLLLPLVVISSLTIQFVPQILTIFYSIPFFTRLLIVGTGLMVLLLILFDMNRQYRLKEKKIFENNLQPTL